MPHSQTGSDSDAVHPVLNTRPATADTPHRVDPGTQRVDPGSLPTLFAVTCIDLDVTEDCNLGCLYCFKGEMFARHMSLATMKRSLEWLLMASGDAERVNVNFMGGEPTMRWRQIRQFLPWARRRGRSVGKHVTFSMTSNLTLFTDEIRQAVDDYGFGVLMSIDGCPEVQDAQRPAKNGKPVSQTVEYWAKSMLKTRPNSTARATIYPAYARLFSKSVRYLHSIGFREVSVSASDYETWTASQLRDLRRAVFETVDFVEERLAGGEEFNLTVFKYYINKLIQQRHQGRSDEIAFQHQPCGAGRGYMMVDYTGDVWPCHRFDGADTAAQAGGQFRLGNIFAAGFNEPLQRAFVSFDHEQVHKDSCTTCPVNPVCGGYCPAANLSDTGSIYTPHDTFCTWSQLMYEAADQLFLRIARRGEAGLKHLLESVTDAVEDGQK